MKTFVVSYEIYGDSKLHRTEVLATCEANAIAKVQLEGHKVHWACQKELV